MDHLLRRAALLAAFPLVGCVASGHGGIRPLRPLELATAPYDGTVAKVLVGSLMYEGGCLLFREERTGARLLPVWPTQSVFNGTSVIFHEPGKAEQPILVSQQFVMEGRPLPWTELPGGYAPFEHQCSAEPFMVAKVRPAD
jgi:hypothetical protein